MVRTPNLLPPLPFPPSRAPASTPSALTAEPIVPVTTPGNVLQPELELVQDAETGDWIYLLGAGASQIGYLQAAPQLFEGRQLTLQTRSGNRTWLGQYVLDIQLYDALGQRVTELDPPLTICVQQQSVVGLTPLFPLSHSTRQPAHSPSLPLFLR